MSASKNKGQEKSQRGSTLQRSNSNSGSKQQSSNKVIEERKNEIKRKLLEQMQADLRQHPEGQAKTYEMLDNAKKLKKMLVDSIYQNRDPLFQLINHQQQFNNNNNMSGSDNNSHNNIFNSNTIQNSSSTLKVVKFNQQPNNQPNKQQSIKQRSSSVQREYQSNKNELQPHYSHLNFIPNDTQSKSNNTSYRQLYNQANTAFQEQCNRNESNERQTLNGKKQVTFTDPSSRQSLNGKSSASPKHQCFHKETCPKHKHHQNQDLASKCFEGEDKSCNPLQQAGSGEDLKETGKFQVADNQHQMENRGRKSGNKKEQLNSHNQINSAGSSAEKQKNEGFSTVKKELHNSSQKKNGSTRNSPSPQDREQSSTQKQNRSYSASNSAKKQGYQQLIESEEEKQEIFKKIQTQKDQIAAKNHNNNSISIDNSNKKNRMSEDILLSSGKKQENTQQDKSTTVNAHSARKPPPSRSAMSSSHQSSAISIHNNKSQNIPKQTVQKNKQQLQNQQTVTNKGHDNQEKKDTLQKQRSVSTQQYQKSTTVIPKNNQQNVRSQSKGASSQERFHNPQHHNRQGVEDSNTSFEKDNSMREQKIVDLQRMIEKMKVENNNRINHLEVKKLGEHMEKDKIIENQILELKQQQKTIFLLTQEKDLLQEQSNSFENKYSQLQIRFKHFEKQRMELDNEIQRQILSNQELKNQQNENKLVYNDLSKRHALLKKQYDELENEKNKINNQKHKIETDAALKQTQYQCMNKQTVDLTIEFERKNKDSQYQINQLIEKVNNITKKYEESSKNEALFEKKFKAEQQAKEQLRVELKLIQAQISENEELKRKVHQKENKLEELEGVVDDLKRKIRNNLDIDMKAHSQNNRQMVEKIVEKPVYIDRKVEVEKSTFNSNLAHEYKAQMIKCQQDISEIKRMLMQEQEMHHQKSLECETWKNHAFQIEDKLRGELNMLQHNFEQDRNSFDQELRDKENYIRDLQSKINTLLEELETLTHKNIDKNRQIANEIINSNSVIQINDTYHNIPNYFQASQNANNQSYISYIHG